LFFDIGVNIGQPALCLLSESDVKEILKVLDTDGSGSIEFNEFQAWLGNKY